MKLFLHLTTVLILLVGCQDNPLSDLGNSSLGSGGEGLTSLNPIRSIELDSAYPTPGLLPNPIVIIKGVRSGETVTVYQDSSCQSPLASGIATGSSIEIQIVFSQPGNYNLYASRFDPSLNLNSDCSSQPLNYILMSGSFPTVTLTGISNITAVNQNAYSVTGTCSEEGRDVSVQISTLSFTAPCNLNNFALINLDVSSLPDGSSHFVRASQTNADGFSSQVASVSIIKDTAGDFLTLNTPDTINASNENIYRLTGTCTSVGNIVDVNIGAINVQVLCSSGNWSTNFVDVSALADSLSVNITVSHETATPIATTVVKDSSAPVVTLSSSPDINPSNQSSYQISGTCSENAENVDLNIGGLALSVVCNAGSWVSGAVDVSGLAEGSIAITVDHSNGVGDPANQVVVNVNKNTTTPSVTNLSVASTLTTSADLTWTLVNPGGFTVSDYQIRYRKQNTTTWILFNDGVSTNTSAQVDGLLASTTYEFRVRAEYNGFQFSEWSAVATADTKNDNPLFNSPYKVMNVGGASTTSVASYYDGTNLTLNGAPVAGSPFSAGQVVTIPTALFDVLDADKPFFAAGRRGSGGNTQKANVVWSPATWAGKSFSFNAIRNNAQELQVYAVEDTTVQVKQGATVLASSTLTAGNGATLNWSVYGSYQVVSTGLILAYHMSVTGGADTVDPKPILPSSVDIIGFPSNSMRLTADFNGTNYTAIHSNSISTSGSLNSQDNVQINPQGGTTTLYRSESLRVTADQIISGASFADSNGNCAAPFFPTNLMKRNYIINTNSDWVAFASTEAGTISVYSPAQTIGVDPPVATLTLTRSGGNLQAPYRAYRASTNEGFRFVSTVPVAGWYQPDNDGGSANEDETLLFGTDE